MSRSPLDVAQQGSRQDSGSRAEARLAIRSATAGDVEALLALEKRCFRGAYAPHRFDARQFEYYLSNPKAIVLVTTRGGAPLGYVLALLSSGARGHVARILGIAVDPQHRRRGLGHALLEQCIAQSRDAGRSVFGAEVLASNTAAVSLFRGLGFRPTRRLPDYYGPGAHGVRLRLDSAERRLTG